MPDVPTASYDDEPGTCRCGHYWTIHKDGCTGWRHPDHTPAWARALRRVRIVVLLRCKCAWTWERLA